MKVQHIILPLLFTCGIFGLQAQENGEYRMLDDFTGGVSRLGTPWEGFTDQVMGGRSDMDVVRVNDPAGPYIRMQGNVSLERNGGFIQVRLKLTEDGSPFDGSPYRGIRLTVRGEDYGYYIFLRTTRTVFPWKFFKAEVPVTEEWSVVEIPWSAFGPGDYGRVRPLDVRNLKSIALTAYGREFRARIDMKEIGLY